MQRAFFHKKTSPPVQATRDDGLHRGTTLIQSMQVSIPCAHFVLLYCRTSIRLTARDTRFSPKGSHAETSEKTARDACSRRHPVSDSRCFPYSRMFTAYTLNLSVSRFRQFVNRKAPVCAHGGKARRTAEKREAGRKQKRRPPHRKAAVSRTEKDYLITRTRTTSSRAAMESAALAETSPVTSRMV